MRYIGNAPKMPKSGKIRDNNFWARSLLGKVFGQGLPLPKLGMFNVCLTPGVKQLPDTEH